MFYKINLILCLIFINLSSAGAQEQFEQDPFLQNEVESSEIKEPSLNKNTAVSYANFREKFSRFCYYLVSDGKHNDWNVAIEKARVSNDQCRACRALYKGLNCKSKDSTSNKKVLMPATELLAVVSDIFRTIAADEALENQTTQALNPVIEDLKQINDLVSREYFQILVEYIRAPLFQAFQINQEKTKGSNKAVEQRQINNLF